MTKRILILVSLLGLGFMANAQVQHPEYGVNDTITVYATFLEDGTMVPTSALPMVEVVGKMPRWMAKKKKEMTRLRNAVYVTYPYAREAGRIINYMNQRMATMKDERTKTAFIKMQEKELKTAFGDKITNLSVYQGKVLMKLINRETGTNVFDILKEYRGGVNARLWQTIAFVFGSSLKQPYNAQGEDAEIEGYVREVQMLYGG
jgi:Domain of unknown function (DUF4294)